MKANTRQWVVATLAIGVAAGCGGGDDDRGLPSGSVITFTAPLDGTTLTVADDVDAITAGVQFDVVLNVTSNQEGAELVLSNSGDSESERTIVLEGDEVGEGLTFESYSLVDGENVLTANVVLDEVVITTATVTVTVDSSSTVTPTLSLVAPLDGATLGAGDDSDTDAAGLQFTVRAESTDLAEETPVVLTLNGAEAGTGSVVNDEVEFEDVTLPEGNVTIAVSTEVDGEEIADEITVTVDTGACVVTLEPAQTDGCGWNLESVDEDPDTEGFQTTFTVTTDCDTASLAIDGELVVEGVAVDNGSREFRGITIPEGAFVAQATAATGDREGASAEQSYRADFTAPAVAVDPSLAGTVSALDDLDDTVDGIQWAANGFIDDADATVSLSVVAGDTATLVETTVEDGTWLSDAFTLPDANELTLTASATDTCGNVGTSEPVLVTVDATADDLVIESPLAGSLFGAGADEDLETEGFQTSFVVAGTVDAGTAIDLFCGVNGGTPVVVASGVATDAGGLTVQATLPEGEVSCTAIAPALDAVASPAVTFLVDVTAPGVSIVSPVDGSVLPTAETILDVVVTGLRPDESAPATFQVGDFAPEPVLIADGGFRLGLTLPIAPGERVITVTVADQAANVTVATTTVTLDLDAPELTAIFPLADSTLLLDDVTVNEGAITIDAVVGVDCEGVLEVCATAGALAEVCVPCAAETTFPGVALTPGANTIVFTATDLGGNEGTLTVNFTVDVSLPSLSISSPADGSVIASGTVTVTAATDLSEGDSVDLLVGDTVVATATAAADGTVTFVDVVLPEGPSTLQVRATDERGLGSSPAITVTVDSGAPELAFVTPVDGAVFNAASTDASGEAGFQIDGSLTWSDATGVTSVNATLTCGETASILGAIVADGTITLSGVTLPDEGSCTLEVTAADAAGNATTASVNLTIDRVGPTIDDVLVVEDADDNGVLNADEGSGSPDVAVEITVQVTGLADGTEIELVTSNPAAGTVVGTGTVSGGVASVFGNLAQGDHTFTVTGQDAAGNALPATTFAFTVDTEVPTLAFTQPLDGDALVAGDDELPAAGFQTTVSLTTDQPDGAQVALAYIDSDLGVTSLGVFTVSAGLASGQVTLAEGAGTLFATTSDAASNDAEASVAVVVDTGAPVVTSIRIETDLNEDGFINLAEAGAGSGARPVSIRVVIAGIEDGQSVSVVTNNPAGGTVVGTGAVSGGAVTISGSLAQGEHSLTIQATDASGNPATGGSADVIVDTVAPLLAFEAPVDGAAFTSGDDESGLAGFQTTLRITTDLPDGTELDVLISQGEGDSVLTTLTVEGGLASGSVTLPEGSLTLSVSADDAAGNSTEDVVSVSLDSTAPFISGITVLSDANNDGFVNIAEVGAGAGTRPVQVRVTLSGIEDGQTVIVFSNNPSAGTGVGSGVVSGGTVTLTVPLAQGNHLLTASASDLVGNPTAPFAGRAITVDTVVPTVAITAPTAATLNSSNDTNATLAGLQANLTFTTDAPVGSSAVVTTTPQASTSQPVGTIAVAGASTTGSVSLPEGRQVVLVTVTDAAGNSASANRTYTVDSVRPVLLTITTPNDANNDGFVNAAEATSVTGSNAGLTVAMTFSGLETNRTVQVFREPATLVGSGPSTVNAASVAVTLGQGASQLRANTVDAALNALATPSPRLSITIDTVAPTLSITAPAEGATLLATADLDAGTAGLQFNASVTTDLPNGASVTLRAAADGNPSTLLGTFTVAGGVAGGRVTLPDGENVVVTASATDLAGNPGSDSNTITVDSLGSCDLQWVEATSPLLISGLDDLDENPADGLQVQLTLSSSNAACNGSTVTINVDDAPFTGVLLAGTVSIEVTFPIEGTGTVVAAVPAPGGGAPQQSPTLNYISDGVAPVIVSAGGVNAGSATAILFNQGNRSGGTWPLIAQITGANGETATAQLNAVSYTATITADTASFTGLNAPDGSYSLLVVAADDFGNEASATFSLVIDTTGPDLSGATFTLLNRRNGNSELTIPTESGATSYEVRVSSSAITNWSALDGDPNNQAFTGAAITPTLNLVYPTLPNFQGNNFIGIRAVDNHGNLSERLLTPVFVGFRTRDISVGLRTISSITEVGDLNDDGFQDIAVGGTDSASATTAIIVYGNATGTFGVQQTLAAPTGAVSFGLFPNGVGDVNGDGIHDLLVSASGSTANDTTSVAYLYFGSAGTQIDGTADVKIEFTGAVVPASGITSFAAYTMNGHGNVIDDPNSATDDGLSDIVIGAGGADSALSAATGSDGIIFLIGGRTTWPATLTVTTNAATNAALGVGTIASNVAAQRIGRYTSVIADANSDGFDEVVSVNSIGPTGGAGLSGRVFVYAGAPLSPTVIAGQSPTRVYSGSNGATQNFFYTNGYDADGDLNGDGRNEVLVVDIGNTTVPSRLDYLTGAAPLPASGALTGVSLLADATLRAFPSTTFAGDIDRNATDPLAGAAFSDVLVRLRDRANTAANQTVALYFNSGASPFISATRSVTLFNETAWTAAGFTSGADLDSDGFPDFAVTATSVPANTADAIVRFFY